MQYLTTSLLGVNSGILSVNPATLYAYYIYEISGISLDRLSFNYI
jgi:hypothetical protein